MKLMIKFLKIILLIVIAALFPVYIYNSSVKYEEPAYLLFYFLFYLFFLFGPFLSVAYFIPENRFLNSREAIFTIVASLVIQIILLRCF